MHTFKYNILRKACNICYEIAFNTTATKNEWGWWDWMIEVDKRVLEEYMVCSFDLLTTFSSTYITCILFTPPCVKKFSQFYLLLSTLISFLFFYQHLSQIKIWYLPLKVKFKSWWSSRSFNKLEVILVVMLWQVSSPFGPAQM